MLSELPFFYEQKKKKKNFCLYVRSYLETDFKEQWTRDMEFFLLLFKKKCECGFVPRLIFRSPASEE